MFFHTNHFRHLLEILHNALAFLLLFRNNLSIHRDYVSDIIVFQVMIYHDRDDAINEDHAYFTNLFERIDDDDDGFQLLFNKTIDIRL